MEDRAEVCIDFVIGRLSIGAALNCKLSHIAASDHRVCWRWWCRSVRNFWVEETELA